MPISGRVTIAVVCAALAAVTIAAYRPVLCCDFVSLDDVGYVVENQQIRDGLTLDVPKRGTGTFSFGKRASPQGKRCLSLLLERRGETNHNSLGGFRLIRDVRLAS
jgi:hypothetical protein